MSCCPSALLTVGPLKRAVMSSPPPGALAIRNRIGLLGQPVLCACAGSELKTANDRKRQQPAPRRLTIRAFISDLLGFYVTSLSTKHNSRVPASRTRSYHRRCDAGLASAILAALG